ncbi:Glycosidase [Pseudoxanthomonas sp. GM95]|uniref:alpha-amylase family glycosyl hydrolase n=1 Tax=Pseudoxanthomonas sp. GM95 TaxID=1881043 RepID=UPI0008CD58DB|nr:alpha-amylase family glycosyl hydrolase [Pseudoxanthomonas sp. GM95]SEL85666.1 Glycosidase [Pseudoxanthomonas sp. GM95]
MPSPDWRDQVIYFAMIDRFADGDPRNNDQHADEYDPADSARFSGGDLAGLRQRLDYIAGLGATTLWITPPVANQWWNPRVRYGGYHGYWASDFSAVDAHFGTLADYQALSRDLHGRGMYLVQDIVVNHTGDWFGYDGAWDPKDPARHFFRQTDTQKRQAPVQAPFDRNDARDPAQRAEAIYHWTPDIRSFADQAQMLDWQLAGLDDLNTDNPRVQQVLRDTYADWVRKVGVDGFRVDTAFYVPPAFFDAFLHAPDPAHPGVEVVARQTGRDDFLSFGEGFGLDRPGEDTQARRIETYVRDAAGKPLMPGMLNFPLYGTATEVFARGRPTADLAFRITNMMQVHRDPHRMPSFIDNHDVDRFLSNGSTPALKQALLMLMTLPGIPVIYYGTEQGYTGQRTAMFAGGFGAQGRDHFDMQAPLYAYLESVIALRRGDKTLSRGNPTVLASSATGPGGLVYRIDFEGQQRLVAFNTAAHPVLVDAMDTGLAAGARLVPAFSTDAPGQALQVDGQGRLNLLLPPQAGLVWTVQADANTKAKPASASPAPRVDPLPATPPTRAYAVSGQAAPGTQIAWVVDGDLAQAATAQADAQGRWKLDADASSLADPDVPHRGVAWDGSQASAPQVFRINREWTPVAAVDDPAGDDCGPSGRYRYFKDPGRDTRGTLDLRAAKVERAGNVLRLTLRTERMLDVWQLPNGFDHVAFTVYLSVPGMPGPAAMPLQNDVLPDGLHWQYRLRVHGASAVLTSAEGADAGNEGTPLLPAPRVEAVPEHGEVILTVPTSALPDGGTLVINTWDYDGGYRALVPSPQGMAFGGGDGRHDPLWMDQMTLVLPAQSAP